MTDRFNTIAGWVLFAGIIALGSSIVAGEMINNHRPHEMGYPIPGVVAQGEAGAKAEQPIAVYLAAADPAKGAAVFKKCAACHNADAGGPNALGPNLHAIMGAPVAAKPGFAYSAALKGKGGTWDWDTMSAWLASPKKFAPGTKMTFAGLSSPEERANLMAWLNSQGSNLPLPAAPAGGAAASGAPAQDSAAKPGSGTNDGAQRAENEPVVTEQQSARSPNTVGGEGAAKVTGPSGVAKKQ